MRGWEDLDGWAKLRRGEGCPLCEVIAASFDEDPYGVTLVRTQSTLIRLGRNQRARGYSTVIALRHVIEPFELTVPERGTFFEDVALTGQAIQQVCNPIKLNYELLGNGVPHLHCHVLPRYAGDGSPAQPLPFFDLPPIELSGAEFVGLTTALRAELARLLSSDDQELRFEPLGIDDLPSLQTLCESCADYYHLMTGSPVSSSEAHTLYTLRPETAALEDKFLIAVR